MNRQQPRSVKRQRGQMGIIGVVVGIALMALVIYGVVKFLKSGSDQNNATTEASNLTTMITGAQKLYNGVPTGFANVSNAVLINNGVVPTGSFTTPDTINSAFGQTVTVTPVDFGGATNGGIQFEEAVPQGACADFAKAVELNANSITVGGTSVKDTSAGTNSIDPTALGTACSTATNGNVTIDVVASL